jgi:hypothetical protein
MPKKIADIEMTQAPPAPETAPDGGGAAAEARAAVLVATAQAGGRRRAGRHWPQGATHALLTPDEIAAIKADPHFTVSVPA